MSKTVAETLERAAAAADSMTEQVANRAHDVIDRAASHASEAEAKAREAAALSLQKFEGAQLQAREQLDESLNRLAEFMRERPMAAAGMIFAAGACVALLLRR